MVTEGLLAGPTCSSAFLRQLVCNMNRTKEFAGVTSLNDVM